MIGESENKSSPRSCGERGDTEKKQVLPQRRGDAEKNQRRKEIGPRFRYLGELIPNQVFIQNLSKTSQANYTVKSGPRPWTYFGYIAPGVTQAIYVQWPTSVALFTNDSGGGVNIKIYGDGIFPVPPGTEEE